jgi:hypothetical protein
MDILHIPVGFETFLPDTFITPIAQKMKTSGLSRETAGGENKNRRQQH